MLYRQHHNHRQPSVATTIASVHLSKPKTKRSRQQQQEQQHFGQGREVDAAAPKNPTTFNFNTFQHKSSQSRQPHSGSNHSQIAVESDAIVKIRLGVKNETTEELLVRMKKKNNCNCIYFIHFNLQCIYNCIYNCIFSAILTTEFQLN